MRSAPISRSSWRRASASPARSSSRRCWSALIGIAIERLLFRRFYRSDPILSLLLTFGLAMVIEQGLRIVFGAAPLPFSIPPELRGQIFVGDFIYPRYRLVILARRRRSR